MESRRSSWVTEGQIHGHRIFNRLQRAVKVGQISCAYSRLLTGSIHTCGSFSAVTNFHIAFCTIRVSHPWERSIIHSQIHILNVRTRNKISMTMSRKLLISLQQLHLHPQLRSNTRQLMSYRMEHWRDLVAFEDSLFQILFAIAYK